MQLMKEEIMTKHGGVTIPIFHCVFNGHESITSFTREFDENMYRALPNLYAICLSDNSSAARKIVAGFFIKTSYTHQDPEFLDAITAVAKSTKELSKFMEVKSSFLPARLGPTDSEPLSELEMLKIMSEQSLKFSAAGNA